MMGRKGREPRRVERVLVQRLLAAEPEAFEELFEEHYDGLYRFTLTRVAYDEALAEELTQAAFVKAISKIDTFRGEAALFSWLCTFCRFEVSAHHRSRKWVPARVDGVDEVKEVREALEDLAFMVDGADDSAITREAAGLVHETLDSLRSHYRQALSWKYFDGLPVNEIAARLEMSPKAAESVLTRAREAFRLRYSALSGQPKRSRT